MNSVTSGVRHGQNLVIRARDKVAFSVPISSCYFLAVLGDAWNLALVLSVEKDDGTFV